MLLSLLLFAIALPLGAEGFEAKTPHFRVITTGPSEIASSAAISLEKTCLQLKSLGFEIPVSRMDVVVFPDAAAMEPYAPTRGLAGFFQQGTDSSFLVAEWKDSDDPRRNLAHELVHRVLLGHSTGRPHWLQEGIADLLSNLQDTPGGIRLGSPIAGHLGSFQRTSWMAWPQVLSSDPSGGPIFYAQSWLLAHTLIVNRAFPGSLAQRIEALREPDQFPDRIPNPLPVELFPGVPAAAGEEAAVTPLEAWEWEHRLAELLRASNRNREARENLVALRVRFPGRPEPAESLGAIAMDGFQYDQAEKWFAEAVRFGTRNAGTYYRYSLLLLRPGGSAEGAARQARRAVELDPAEPLYWLAQAHAEMQLSHWDAARESLTRMQERASDPVLREQAPVEFAEIERRIEQERRPAPVPKQQAAVVVSTVESNPPARAPRIETPKAVAPRQRPGNLGFEPGTVLFWGYVRQVECTDQGKILTVTTPRLVIRVRERPGQPAKLYSAPKNMIRIPCSLKNVEVNVVYRPMGNAGAINGDLVAVVF